MSGRSPGRAGGLGGRLAYLPYLLPGLLLFAGVIGIPFLMNIGTSFTEWSGVGSPEWVGLENYKELMGDEKFWSSFRNNVFVIIGMAIVPTIVGLVLAGALTDLIDRHFGSRTAAVLRACIYLPQVLPVVIAGVVWSWLLAPDGGAVNALLDAVGLGSLAHNWLGDPDTALWSVLGVMVWTQIGFPLVIFMSGLQRVDPSLYEAAEIDGASWARRFWHVTVPQIRPEIFVVLLWTTIAALKAFPQIFVLTKGGPGGATNVPSYYSYVSFFEKQDVGYGSAIATVLTLVIIALTVVFLRAQGRELEGEDR
ncbi:carbohydrate ABC transporter permease [Actinomadura algeriensis]|uniref:Raffinose/stachyose/melibiose transport system permease protein n=1 Tax=Actinomadura algeriensis TaxID=1679523 RepID=A0ABR9K4G2_9ACTN|nr:sugar ABC transporter permease [Actinomadura algeriensis]MBE1537731.1 raffinose/stachyose/melibiose transport system permease protein [Actinomadura algeriensis]